MTNPIQNISDDYRIKKVEHWKDCVATAHGGGWCITDSRDMFSNYKNGGEIFIVTKRRKNGMKPYACVYKKELREQYFVHGDCNMVVSSASTGEYTFEIAIRGNKHLKAYELIEKDPELEQWLDSIGAQVTRPQPVSESVDRMVDYARGAIRVDHPGMFAADYVTYNGPVSIAGGGTNAVASISDTQTAINDFFSNQNASLSTYGELIEVRRSDVNEGAYIHIMNGGDLYHVQQVQEDSDGAYATLQLNNDRQVILKYESNDPHALPSSFDIIDRTQGATKLAAKAKIEDYVMMTLVACAIITAICVL